ncbi:MAG: PQQ-dependent sugar dehydrogenase [Deltaproteobacteria bacterium]|nr:PQQ-dependent sugar dehydrogenase [Deltaproteobacteria bacterium]
MKLRRVCLVVAAATVAVAACKASGDKDEDGAGGESGAGGDTSEQGGGAGGAAMGGRGNGGAAGGTAGAASSAAGAGGSKPGSDTGGASGGNGNPVSTAKCVPPKLKLTRVTTADTPMVLTQPASDPRLYIAERGGRIKIFKDGKLVSDPFLDMAASVYRPDGENERGLLGLAFHPNYKDNGRFFVFYTRSQNDMYSQGTPGDVVIAEGKRSGNPEKAERATRPISTVRHDYDDFHNGGFFAFGKDGLLYAGVGDSGEDGYKLYGGMSNIQKQIVGKCQDPKEKLCKILRINVDKPTERPAGNWENGDVHVWALGVRNPFRGSFDRVTGDLYFGDVGEHTWEEINYAPAGSAGKNWGWALAEGKRCFPWFHKFACDATNELPLIDYFHAGDGVTTDPTSYMTMGKACTGGTMTDCSRAVVGGYVYRGKKIADLQGRYIYGDHVKNTIFSTVVSQGKPTCDVDLTSDLRDPALPIQGITSFGEDADGELYILDLFGNVYRIEQE